ncbi:3-phosphoshikimate 1-carboxyvinyltransferase [Lachnospiraceae bacterium]|nr:3-phosphoshikimate 1-carboxyvinyltransferase [Lachnospiraceae bacterium]
MSSTSLAPLRGSLSVGGDKSITHRAILLASIADGKSIIRGENKGIDCLRTLRCMQQLGVPSFVDSQGLVIEGRGLRGLCPVLGSASGVRLDCGNSGTTARLLCGILAGQHFPAFLFGDRSLSLRPMERIARPLRQMGASIVGRSTPVTLPLQIAGGTLHSISYRSQVASAQVKSAVLFASLYAEGESRYTEPFPSRDHSERMLEQMGASIYRQESPRGAYTLTVEGTDRLSPLDLTIPGDFSTAAYLIAAALLIPDSALVLRRVGVNPGRTGFLDALRQMGADIRTEPVFCSSPEPQADLYIRYRPLRGINVGGSLIPRMIDELPIFAVLACAAEGISRIRDAKELRYKESDRIQALLSGISALGIKARALPDGLEIEGTGELLHRANRTRSILSSCIDTRGDHRIAMAFSVLSLLYQEPLPLSDVSCVSISAPEFFPLLKKLLASC